MSKNTFIESKDIYVKTKPKKIEIYARLQAASFLSPQAISYSFSFSENEVVREKALKKSSFLNTTDLFRYIIWDFINNKRLLSVTYDLKKTKNSDYGIKLKNRNGESLNIYYTPKISFSFEQINHLFQAKKYYDFYQYGKECIDEGLIEHLHFYKNRISSINLASTQSASLVYNYRNEQYGINAMDQACIIALIRYFIKYKLKMQSKQKHFIEYRYSDVTKADASVSILINKKSFVRITNPDLVHTIEKNGIIDEIYSLNNQNQQVNSFFSIEEVETKKLEKIFKK